MDLLVIGSQETRNSSKRVRRNGEGKTDLLCSKWFWTRHCLLRTVLTFSHTSWSHYSKVFFVKGKGGKRASRISSERQQKEESRGWEREGPQRRAAQQRKGRRKRKRTHERERDKPQREKKEADPVTQAFFFWRLSISWFSNFSQFACCLLLSEILQKMQTYSSGNFWNSQFALREKSKKWNFEIMETRNMLKTGNQQSAWIPELRKHQDAHWHVEILLKWETENPERAEIRYMNNKWKHKRRNLIR